MKSGKHWMPLLAALGLTASLMACLQGGSSSPTVAPDGTMTVVGVVQCGQLRGLITVGQDGIPHGIDAKAALDAVKKYTNVLPDKQTVLAVIPCAPPEGSGEATAHHPGETNI